MSSGASDTPRWADRILGLDRRWIYLAVAVAVIIPLLFPLRLAIRPSKEAIAFRDAIAVLEPGSVVLFSFDYEADTRAELDPMSEAIWNECFRRGLRLVALTNYPGGPGVAEPIMRGAAQRQGKTYGVDYVFLGFNPDWSGTMLRLGESFKATFPRDHSGRPLEDLPLMTEVDSYKDTPLLISIASSQLAEYWTIWAGGKFGQKIVCGTTAIQAVGIYPYYQTGQVLGFLGGLKGAAEYERLTTQSGAATTGMDAQTTAHGLIAALVVLGNIAYWAQRRARRG